MVPFFLFFLEIFSYPSKYFSYQMSKLSAHTNILKFQSHFDVGSPILVSDLDNPKPEDMI